MVPDTIIIVFGALPLLWFLVTTFPRLRKARRRRNECRPERAVLRPFGRKIGNLASSCFVRGFGTFIRKEIVPCRCFAISASRRRRGRGARCTGSAARIRRWPPSRICWSGLQGARAIRPSATAARRADSRGGCLRPRGALHDPDQRELQSRSAPSAGIAQAAQLRDKARTLYEQAAKKAGKTPEKLPSPSDWNPAWDLAGLVRQGQEAGVARRQEGLGETVAGLQELICYGVKGRPAPTSTMPASSAKKTTPPTPR